MKIRITRVDKSLPLPKYQTRGAAGFDLYSRIAAPIKPGEQRVLPTNLIVRVPTGHMLLIAARSSIVKKGLQFPNGIGIIDQDFHGPRDEIIMVARNISKKTVPVQRGERLGQGVFVKISRGTWNEKKPAKKKSRGGFGSTG